MQNLISWLLQKPTDLDLHCLQRHGIAKFSRIRVKTRMARAYGVTSNILGKSGTYEICYNFYFVNMYSEQKKNLIYKGDYIHSQGR